VSEGVSEESRRLVAVLLAADGIPATPEEVTMVAGTYEFMRSKAVMFEQTVGTLAVGTPWTDGPPSPPHVTPAP